MPHHWQKSVVEASIFCSRCMKMTPWKIADGRQQYCLVCQERKEAARKVETPIKPPEQGNLF